MSRRWTSSALVIVSALSLALGSLPAVAKSAKNAAAKTTSAKNAADPVVAKVNGTEIHRSDLQAELNDMPNVPAGTTLAQAYPQLLERQVKMTLVNQAAHAANLQRDPEYKKRVDLAAQEILDQLYLTRAVKQDIPDATVKAKYDQLVANMGNEEEINAKHILLKTEPEAKAVIAKLEEPGATFDSVSAAEAKDENARVEDLGWFTPDKMVPEFSAAAEKLQKGQYTTTPVKTQFGWHVIYLVDRRKVQPPPYDQVKDRVRQQIIAEAVQQKIAQLRSSAKVEEFNIDGSPLPTEPAPPGKGVAGPAAAP